MRRAMLCLAVLAVGILGPTVVRAQAGGDVHVTVTYKAKGAVVDDTHEILVFLFANPIITANSEPLGMQAVKKNGGTASFTGVSADPVYVVAVFDEKGTYDGVSGPPPAGTPIGMYSKDPKKGEAAPVKPGAAAKIKMTFTDARRWGQ